MASCGRPDLKQKLYRYVRGEIEVPAERAEVQEHVAACAECSAVIREMQWLLGTMRRPGGPGYDEEFEREMGGLLAPPAPEPPRRTSWKQRFRLWLSTGGSAKQ